MKCLQRNLVVLVVLVLANLSICEGQTQESSIIAEPTLVRSVEKVFSDTFDKANPTDPNRPDGWEHWQQDSDPGKAMYDRECGRRDKTSLCLVNSFHAVWLRQLQMQPGAMYRLSVWFKGEKKSKGRVALAIVPKIISKTSSKKILFNKQRVQNDVQMVPGDWARIEVFWTAPATCKYLEGKLDTVDVHLIGVNLKGKVWFDDVALERVVVDKPFRDDFRDK